ncbi:beta-lactamase family protein [Streptomyces sp. NBC_00654]|uniref:serine hydrolase domain-containing protein n=1 Tax=Streptomyces sp. NBC_00654 TaxID=2975799 RepID=UPI00225713FD|nr:serine hydrolase domain-containing protein [Streptomyces sp. NBC_00654]MCX4967375.1 beta-lactamase family protein [Streptomyces sp. NBC_00654]
MEPTTEVLVTRGPAVVYETRTGAADVGKHFQIASLSKQFAAAAALLLAEDGTLALTDQLVDRVPGCPSSWAGITVHHLLTHTSGLPHWDPGPGPGPGPGPDPDTDTGPLPPPLSRVDTIAHVMRLLPLAEPGQRWHYSSPGYVLTALLVEHTTGRPYADILRERVLSPLGLSRTGTTAPGHRDGTGNGEMDPSCLPGAGDLWSTAGDLARWARALERGHLLGPDSLHRMFTSHIAPRIQYPMPLTVTGYGYGVFLGTLAGHPARFHHGDNPGHRSLLVRLPGQDTGIIVLTRDNHTDPYATLSALLATSALRL